MDSVLFHYNKSKEQNLSLDKKYESVNKSFSFVKNIFQDTLYSKVLYQKNYIHLSLKQYDSLKIYADSLVNHGARIDDKNILGKHFYLIGYYYDIIEQIPDSAYFNYNLSKNYFQSTQNDNWVSINLLRMAVIQQNQNDYFGSKETITEALQFLNKLKDSNDLSSAYNELGTNHRKLLNYSDASKYHLKAIENTNSKKDRFIYINNLATTYIDSGQFNDALSLLETIVEDSLLRKNRKEYPRILDNLAYSKWLSSSANNKQEFLKPLQLRKQNNDQRGQIASYTHLGEFYSKTNPKRAEKYFDSVIQLSKTLKIPRAEKDALRFLMKLKPKNVNLRDRHIFLQDSLYVQELKVKTQFAKYKYDDKLKQESILRLEKENAEKELEASQQRNQKILYLGGLLFITSVLGLSLYGFRQRTKRLKQKSKAEKLEAIHETEAELSRKLHDDHGGKLNQAMLMVQRDTDKSVILDKLEAVYNQIRNFSREINAVDTGPDFWKGLKATLEYTKPTEVDMILNGGKELNWSLVGHQTKTILFKVLQELVINMARHSKAKQTVILFKDQNKELYVYYEDDGVGASEESLLRKNGLRNTEKRIQAIGGSITFDSEEGKGFRAEIRIPK